MPILDLMASISSPHFVKLKDFIEMQLPSGFPVKIEIPLFHVMNARITFGNIFARDTSVRHVECVPEGDRLTCLIDDTCFALGRGYRAAGPLSEDRIACIADDDEELLHYAIQQSLMDSGTQRDQVRMDLLKYPFVILIKLSLRTYFMYLLHKNCWQLQQSKLPFIY